MLYWGRRRQSLKRNQLSLVASYLAPRSVNYPLHVFGGFQNSSIGSINAQKIETHCRKLEITFNLCMKDAKNKRCRNFRRNTVPPFLRGKVQHSAKEQGETWQIPSLHIHVERAMEQTKHFHIFDKPLPSSLRDVANQTF